MGDMYVVIWEYRVNPECAGQFVEHYASEGTWTTLFRRAEGYRGTELLRDRKDPARFVTIDRWDGEADWLAFAERFRDEYEALDERFAALTTEERRLGVLELVRGDPEVPSRG